MNIVRIIIVIFFIMPSLFFGGDEAYLPGDPFFFRIEGRERTGPTSQSFMFPRPIFQNISAQQSSYWHNAIFEKNGCLLLSVQAIPFYQQSFSGQYNAHYFLMKNQTSITIRGDTSFAQGSGASLKLTASGRDVRAEWLQLPSDFGGIFSINPQQKQSALWIEANQDVKAFIDHDFFEPFWIGAACAFQEVKNNINPTQYLATGTSATAPHDILEALNNNNLMYGRFSEKTLTERSIAEIHLKFGTRFMKRDGFQIGMTSSLVIPGSRTQRAKYVFDSFAGHNKHIGFGTAAQFQFPLNRDVENKLVALYFIIENLYFLRNFQYRTFDLKQKPWSRFILINSIDGTTKIPGVNVLTRKTKVQPFNFVDLSAGFRMETRFVNFEVGYNLWAHGNEQLKLHRPFPSNQFGIAALDMNGDPIFVPGTNVGATAAKSTIAQQGELDVDSDGNIDFEAIHERDIDLLSASARAAVAHRAHIALGLVQEQSTFALFLGIGGYVEISQNNSAFKNWGFWGKLGGTF